MEKPIIFQSESIRAILAGRKTQTRRIIKPQPVANLFSAIIGGYDNIPFMARFWVKREPNNPLIEDVKLKYNVGDVLWCRETWQRLINNSDTHPKFVRFCYKADKENYPEIKWKPSIFMPKSASRIKLLVKNVSVERVQDITEEDAIAEGIEFIDGKDIGYPFSVSFNYSNGISNYSTAKEAYQALWESINGKGSWEKNPFIYKISFKLIK